MATLKVNGRNRRFTADPSTPLLWVIREDLKLTGTKYGCGIAACGACTVHVDGKAVRSCSMPISAVMGKSVTTIEGLPSGDKNPLVKAWVAEQAPQCGYCQSGQIMQAATLLNTKKNPTREEVIQHMDGNICRCGSYNQIIAAVQRAGREG
jgi:isoquinoline 1-oxidoreductase subunit alpha